MTLLGGAAAWPLAARAQPRERVRRIGALMSLAEDDPEDRQRRAAFQQALRELGWNDLRIDYRWYAGDPARARALAIDVAKRSPAPAANAATITTIRESPSRESGANTNPDLTASATRTPDSAPAHMREAPSR